MFRLNIYIIGSTNLSKSGVVLRPREACRAFGWEQAYLQQMPDHPERCQRYDGETMVSALMWK